MPSPLRAQEQTDRTAFGLGEQGNLRLEFERSPDEAPTEP